MKFKIETWDRKRADEVLRNHNHCNRPLKDKYVDSLVSTYKAGEWVADNGDSIKFDESGSLIDGQHRLQMISNLGITLDLLTVRDCSAAAFKTLDQGKKRKLADVLAMNNVKNAAVCASSLTWFRVFLSDSPLTDYRAGTSLTKGLSLWQANQKWIKKCVPHFLNNPLRNTAMLCGGMAACYKGYTESTVEEFWIPFATGANLIDHTPNHYLRERLIRDNLSSERASSRTKLLWVVKCWKHHTDGTFFDRFHVSPEDYKLNLK